MTLDADPRRLALYELLAEWWFLDENDAQWTRAECDALLARIGRAVETCGEDADRYIAEWRERFLPRSARDTT